MKNIFKCLMITGLLLIASCSGNTYNQKIYDNLVDGKIDVNQGVAVTTLSAVDSFDPTRYNEIVLCFNQSELQKPEKELSYKCEEEVLIKTTKRGKNVLKKDVRFIPLSLNAFYLKNRHYQLDRIIYKYKDNNYENPDPKRYDERVDISFEAHFVFEKPPYTILDNLNEKFYLGGMSIGIFADEWGKPLLTMNILDNFDQIKEPKFVNLKNNLKYKPFILEEKELAGTRKIFRRKTVYRRQYIWVPK